MFKKAPSILGLIIIGYIAYQYFGRVITQPDSNNKTTVTPLKRQSLKQSKYIVPKLNLQSSSFPKECQTSLSNLSAMTSEEYGVMALDKKIFQEFFGLECLSGLSSNTVFKNILKNANCKIMEPEGKPSEICYTMLFMLKAHFIADHTKDKKPEDMTAQELASNFVKMFFGLDKLTKETFSSNLETIDALHRMYPNDADVLEAYLGYMMIGRQITKDHSVDAQIEELMAEADGNSFKVDRLQALRSIINNDDAGAERSLEKLSQQYPRESEVAYYQAAYYWRQGDRNLANVYLDKAIGMSDQCTYCVPSLYRETRQRIKAADDKDPNLFSVSIGLNFENL